MRQLTSQALVGPALFHTMKGQPLLKKTAVFLPVLVLSLAALCADLIGQSSVTAPREQKLLNGLKLLMFDAPQNGKVTVKVRIHAGSAFDPQGKEGVMKLLAANLFPNQETREFFAEELGGSLEVDANYDYIQIDATANADKLLTVLETVSSAITNIEIDKETTAKLKSRQIQIIGELARDPAYLADRAAAARLLGTFPYGRPIDGTAASIERIDFADLLAAKQRFLSADNATIAVSGKFDQSVAFRAVRRYFGAWLKSDKLVPSTFRQPDDPPGGAQFVESPVADKFEMRLAARGTTPSSPDSAPLYIAARILESRLAKETANVPGTVTVVSQEHVLPGIFLVRFSGTKEPDPKKKFVVADLIAKVTATPVTDDEFQPAKRDYLAGLEKRDIVDRWLDVDTFRTDPPARLFTRASATTLGDIQRVISRLQKQPFAVVVVSGPNAVSQ